MTDWHYQTLRLDPETKEMLMTLASAYGINASAFIRLLIRRRYAEDLFEDYAEKIL